MVVLLVFVFDGEQEGRDDSFQYFFLLGLAIMYRFVIKTRLNTYQLVLFSREII